MTISGRNIARLCIAADESLLPVLLNIASDVTVVMLSTNSVTSASLSWELSGTAGTHVLRYRSLEHTTKCCHLVCETHVFRYLSLEHRRNKVLPPGKYNTKQNNPAKFHPDSIWNNGDLGFFKDVTLTRRTRCVAIWDLEWMKQCWELNISEAIISFNSGKLIVNKSYLWIQYR